MAYKNTDDGAYAFLGVIIILMYITAGVGWCMNVVKLVHMISDPVTGMTFLRVIGLFAPPFGAILGLFF